MIIDVSGLEKNDPTRDFAFSEKGDVFLPALPEGVYFDGEVTIEGRITYTGAFYRVEGVVEGEKVFNCDRCLKPSRRWESYDFAEDFSRSKDVV